LPLRKHVKRCLDRWLSSRRTGCTCNQNTTESSQKQQQILTLIFLTIATEKSLLYRLPENVEKAMSCYDGFPTRDDVLVWKPWRALTSHTSPHFHL